MENTDLHLFFGGSYSNLHALKALQIEAKRLNISPRKIYHTGDVVGYCAFPNETLNLVRDWGINAIAGNVEVQLREDEEDCGCNFDEGTRCANFSTLWYPYAKMNVSLENKAWLKGLSTHSKFEIDGVKIGMIHGGLTDISQFIFKSTPQSIKEEIAKELEVDVVIAGHSGLPFMQTLDDFTWINPGVIGMPANDGTPRVWYTLYNAKTKTFSSHSLSYDHQAASEAMTKNQLPPEYAKTLIDGLWDNCEVLPDAETSERGIRIVPAELCLGVAVK